MSKIEKILQKLNLIYYEYDIKNQIIVLDSKYSNTHTLSELILITYHLTKEKIAFEVMKNKSILLKVPNGFAHKIEKIFNNTSKYLKAKSKNIYILTNQKVKFAKNLPLLHIEYAKEFNTKISKYDAIILTSKHALLAIESLHVKWKDVPVYAISEQSAKLVKDLGGKLAYFSKERHGAQFSQELEPLLKEKKVLYLRAEKVAFPIGEYLRSCKIDCDEEIVYVNREDDSVKLSKLPNNATIIFSSPSTVERFFKVYSWKDSYKAVVIGQTTALAMPENVEYFISETTSLDSCVKKALEL